MLDWCRLRLMPQQKQLSLGPATSSSRCSPERGLAVAGSVAGCRVDPKHVANGFHQKAPWLREKAPAYDARVKIWEELAHETRRDASLAEVVQQPLDRSL